MNKAKRKYNKIEKDIQIIDKEIKALENYENVKKYLELKKQYDELYDKKLKAYKTMKYEDYATCNHILVYTKIKRYEDKIHKSCGCIKCGLDNSVLDKNNLSYSESVMYDYLKKYNFNGIKTENLCNIDLATSIYSKIKESHPNIDDKTALKYFEIALDNIRNINVSNERKKSRAKRLSLNSNFKEWNSKDIYNK